MNLELLERHELTKLTFDVWLMLQRILFLTVTMKINDLRQNEKYRETIMYRQILHVLILCLQATSRHNALHRQIINGLIMAGKVVFM